MTIFFPLGTPAALEARAHLYGQIRQFFRQREVLEVEVPVLAARFVTDPFIRPITACRDGATAYLQSSPEYALKRLLAKIPRSVYSLGKAFRDGEISARHNSEFTLLEWYRTGFDDRALMGEVAELVALALPGVSVNYRSYRAWFDEAFGLDPHCAGRGPNCRRWRPGILRLTARDWAGTTGWIY